MAAADDLALLLQSFSYRFTHEAELQESIQQVLAGAGREFEREVELGSRADRIDFLVQPKIGLEIKVRETTNNILRQLQRYVQSDRIEALVFCTASRRAAAILPRELSGKRIVCATIGGVL